MVEKIFCDGCGNEVGVKEIPVYLNVAIFPRPDGDDDTVEADLCPSCARGLHVDEVLRIHAKASARKGGDPAAASRRGRRR